MAEGLEDGLQSGPLKGYPVQDIRVRVTGLFPIEGKTSAVGCRMDLSWRETRILAEDVLHPDAGRAEGERATKDFKGLSSFDDIRPGDLVVHRDYGVCSFSGLARMINDILIEQEAARLKITVSETELDTQINEIKKKNNLTEQQLKNELLKEGLTLKQFREQLRKETIKKQLLGYMVHRKVHVPATKGFGLRSGLE